MTVKIDEQQMELLNDLLGDTPVDPEPTTAGDAPPDLGVDPGSDPEPHKVEDPEPASSVDPPASVEPANGDSTPSVDDINATLREQIVQLTEQLSKDPLQQAVAPTVTESKDGTAPAPAAQTLQAFLTEQELDRIIDEPQLLNVAFERAINVIQQNVQNVIRGEVNRQVMVSKAVSDFYSTNQDLVPYAQFVKFVMSEIEKANPQKTYNEIFAETATETRRRLGLGTQVRQQGQSVPNQQKPAFAGSKKSTARPAGKQEFFDLNAADMFT